MSEMIKKPQVNGKEILSKGVLALSLSSEDIIYIFLCYAMSLCNIFDGRTPFVLSAYGAAFSTSKWPVFALASFFGILANGFGFSFVAYILVILGASFLMGILGTGVRFKATCVSALFFTFSVIGSLFSDAYWFDYFKIFAESAICFAGVFVFSSAVPLLTDANERRCVLDTELVTLYILLALLIRCVANIPLVLGLDLSVILAIVFLLIINMGNNAAIGSAVGLVFGFATWGGALSAISSAGSFAFASLCAGIMSRFGRVGVILGFVLANTVMTAFFPENTMAFDVFEVMAACLVFVLLPKKVTGYISSLGTKTVHTATKAFIEQDRLQTVVSKKLSTLALSYDSLADSYEKCFVTNTMSKKYIIRMLDTASSKICPECGLKYNCWERRCRETYGAMITMLETAEKNGLVTKKDVPEILSTKCIKLDEFIEKFNRMYEIYKTEKIWQEKLNEARQLVSKQLRGISRSMAVNSEEFNMCLDVSSEKEIKSFLDRQKIPYREITFLKGSDSRFSMEIVLDKWECSKKEEQTIARAIETITGHSATLIYTSFEKDGLSLKFKNKARYSASVGSAEICKHSEKVSGDSFTVCTSLAGELVAALSDGMGTGETAKIESHTATKLMEDFIQSGMDTETTLELINSSLLLRSSGDSFATMDVCCADLDLGKLTLCKSGAAPCYVKTGERTVKVESDSLPFGVLSHYGKINTQTLDAGDFATVIMMSDGVYDAFEINDIGILETLIGGIKTENPQIIASSILKSALNFTDGKAMDDMTVAVINICKN